MLLFVGLGVWSRLGFGVALQSACLALVATAYVLLLGLLSAMVLDLTVLLSEYLGRYSWLGLTVGLLLLLVTSWPCFAAAVALVLCLVVLLSSRWSCASVYCVSSWCLAELLLVGRESCAWFGDVFGSACWLPGFVLVRLYQYSVSGSGVKVGLLVQVLS